jgi:hypothetical protein
MHPLTDKLDITVEDGGAGVSADALRMLLDQTLAFLEDEPGGSDGMVWRVTRATMNSPFSMTLQRVAPESMPEPADRPGERLVRLFAVLSAGMLPDDSTPAIQVRRAAAIAQLAQPGRTVRMGAGRGKVIDIDSEWSGRLKDWLRQKAIEQGMPEQLYSVTGKLEGVDVHGRKSEFYVYDPLTDQKMRCLFDEDMLEKVKESLGERVEVSGLARFNANDEPVRMQVDSLRVIRSRAFLSRLKEAQQRGIMKLTGNLSIDEALREARDGAG